MEAAGFLGLIVGVAVVVARVCLSEVDGQVAVGTYSFRLSLSLITELVFFAVIFLLFFVFVYLYIYISKPFAW